ncbi:MAG: adenylate/guanylate cyclase domain-containing protein [Gammaproteobacteria bacterium]|nr:MAG: adenylate/guanylate cyclase domain-containing protein [Gammaproteobacteria bacterium]
MTEATDTDSREREVAIVFADVVGSTHLYEALGDDRARETVQRCLDIMKAATEQFGGTVIKTMGDEVMATFPSADDAMNAASQMQQGITNNPEMTVDGTHVSIRVGCHFGPVVSQDRDIFGVAVSDASRMTSRAKAGQILITGVTVEQLSGEWKGLVRQIDVTTIRGRSDEVAVFEVLWQPEEATSMLPAVDVAPRRQPAVLRLRYGDQELVLQESGLKAATIGRADDNDLVVKGNLISRLHARLELVRNRFMLIDESTNGTFVQRDDGEEFYVRRESIELTGSGVISLGRVAARGAPLALEYRIEN